MIGIRSVWAATAAAGALLATAAAEISTAAPHAVIMDYESGAVLFAKDAEAPTAPASMSKLMTVAIVFEKLKNKELSLNEEFTVSERAWRMEGSKMWTRVDTKIPLKDLLRGVIVQSGNDACVVIAENISGTEEAFADLMTRKAREWGMAQSTFTNSTGWPDENHKMSLIDLAKLSRKIIKDFPEYYPMFGEKEFRWENITQPNRNPLLFNFDGSDGLKTGHTEESGYGIAGSAKVKDERRIIVIHGLPDEKSRAGEAQRMMRIAFNNFAKKTLYKPGDVVGDARVFAGQAPSVPLTVDQEASMLISRSAASSLRAAIVYEGPVAAPIEAKQQIGVLRVETGEGSSRDFPLYATKAVREIGVVGRISLALSKILAKPAETEPEFAEDAEAE